MGQISVTGIAGSGAPYTIKVFEVGNNTPILTDTTNTANYTGTFSHTDNETYYVVVEKEGCTTYTGESFLLGCSCNCPSGFTATLDGGACVKITTDAPTANIQSLTPINGSTSSAYGLTGVKIFNQGGFNLNGSVNGSYAFSSSNDSDPVRVFWAGNGSVGGRLNLKGTWANGINQPYSPTSNTPLVNGQPFAGTLSYCYSINVPTTKIYYIGIAGDDYCGIKINGTTIIQQVQLTSTPYSNFWDWNIYPVQLQAGINIIEMNNTNIRDILFDGTYDYTKGAFAAEIYDNTLSQLSTATSENNLNILFTTGDYRVGGSKNGQGFCSNYTCPAGYTLDTTNPQSPICKKIEYTTCLS